MNRLTSYLGKNVRRPTKAQLALIAISTILAIVVMEIGARYQAKAWPFDVPMAMFPHLTDKDKTIRWRLAPTEGRNSLGMRNREIAPKRQGQTRILFLGDSLWYWGETSSDDLHTVVIEQNLNSTQTIDYPNSDKTAVPDIEIINAGVRGYTTYQELEFLKIYGLDMEPDLVVLGFVLNDLYYKYLHKPVVEGHLVIDPSAKLSQFDTTTFPGILLARSHFAHASYASLKHIFRRITKAPTRWSSFHRQTDLYLAWTEHGWDNSIRLIGEMRDLLERKNVALVMVIFPISDQLKGPYRPIDEEDFVFYPQTRAKEICSLYGLPCLDLTVPLNEAGRYDMFDDHVHLKPAGNDVLVREVTRFLQDHGELWRDQAASSTKTELRP